MSFPQKKQKINHFLSLSESRWIRQTVNCFSRRLNKDWFINLDSHNGKWLWFCDIDYLIPVQLFRVYKLLGSFNINFVNVGFFETKYILCVILLKNVKVSLTLFFNNIQIQTILFNWVNDQWFWIFAVGEIERKKTRVSIINITATD